MPLIIGVVFRKNGNVHYYDPGEIQFEIGDKAICHADKAIEISEVVAPPTEISEHDMGTALSKIIRKATYYDLSVEELNKSKEEIRKYQLAVVKQMMSLATSAFGLVAALAWNELIKTFIDEFIKPSIGSNSKLVSLTIYALIVTSLAVFITLQLSKLVEKLEEKKL